MATQRFRSALADRIRTATPLALLAVGALASPAKSQVFIEHSLTFEKPVLFCSDATRSMCLNLTALWGTWDEAYDEGYGGMLVWSWGGFLSGSGFPSTWDFWPVVHGSLWWPSVGDPDGPHGLPVTHGSGTCDVGCMVEISDPVWVPRPTSFFDEKDFAFVVSDGEDYEDGRQLIFECGYGGAGCYTIPEPRTYPLLATGLVLLALVGWRRRPSV